MPRLLDRASRLSQPAAAAKLARRRRCAATDLGPIDEILADHIKLHRRQVAREYPKREIRYSEATDSRGDDDAAPRLPNAAPITP